MTSEPGLYGVGCGTHSERPLVVSTTIEAISEAVPDRRNADEIEKIWQELWIAPYWRASVDASNAMAAVDSALWDILGKRAGLPVYDLLGGKVRDGLRMLADVRYSSPQGMEDDIRAKMADGYEAFPHLPRRGRAAALWPARSAPSRLPSRRRGAPPERCTAMTPPIPTSCAWHSRISASRLASTSRLATTSTNGRARRAPWCWPRRSRNFGPSSSRTCSRPEDSEWYKVVRAQSSIGIAMGELFREPRTNGCPLVATTG